MMTKSLYDKIATKTECNRAKQFSKSTKTSYEDALHQIINQAANNQNIKIHDLIDYRLECKDKKFKKPFLDQRSRIEKSSIFSPRLAAKMNTKALMGPRIKSATEKTLDGSPINGAARSQCVPHKK